MSRSNYRPLLYRKAATSELSSDDSVLMSARFADHRKLDTGNWKLGTLRLALQALAQGRLETGNWKLGTANWKLTSVEARNDLRWAYPPGCRYEQIGRIYAYT